MGWIVTLRKDPGHATRLEISGMIDGDEDWRGQLKWLDESLRRIGGLEMNEENG